MCFGLCDIGSAVKILRNARMFSAVEGRMMECKEDVIKILRSVGCKFAREYSLHGFFTLAFYIILRKSFSKYFMNF